MLCSDFTIYTAPFPVTIITVARLLLVLSAGKNPRRDSVSPPYSYPTSSAYNTLYSPL